MIEPQSLRVLCADDNAFVLNMLAKTLKSAGHHVEVARDGRAAVTRVAKDPSYFQLIVTDTRMPHLDGEGFLRGMGGLPASKRVPVVLISAKEDLQQIALRTGAAGYLSKPFEAPQLLSLLEKVLS